MAYTEEELARIKELTAQRDAAIAGRRKMPPASQREVATEARPETNFWDMFRPGLEAVVPGITLEGLGTAGRYGERAAAIGGRAVELGLAGSQVAMDPMSMIRAQKTREEMGPFELPSPAAIPGALRAGLEQLRQGDGIDVDAALAAYEEAAPAGWGYRGLTELGAEMLAPAGLARAGAGLVSRALPMAETLGGIAPKVVRGTGAVMRLPWEAEEAVGRAITRPIAAGWRRFRGGPVAETAQEVAERVDVPDEIPTEQQLSLFEIDELAGPAIRPEPTTPTARVTGEVAGGPPVNAVEQLKAMVSPEGTPQRMFDQRVLSATTAEESVLDAQIAAFTKSIRQLRKQADAAAPDVPGVAPEGAVVSGDPLLPKKLRGAKPRYNMGRYQYVPQFESDIDKAFFIVSQQTPSKSDALYMDFLRDLFPGKPSPQLRILGREVREHIKQTVRGQEEGEVFIPRSGVVQRELDPAKRAAVSKLAPTAGQERLDKSIAHHEMIIRVAKAEKARRAGRPMGEEISDVAFVGSPQPKVGKNVPLNVVLPDNQAGPIVSSADPSPPRTVFDSTPEQAFADLQNLATPTEMASMEPPQLKSFLRKIGIPWISEQKARPLNIISTIMRRHEAAINVGTIEANRIVREGLGEANRGERLLHDLGLSVTRGGREVIREEAIPQMKAFFTALHDSRVPVPPRLRGLYAEIKGLTDFEEIFRIDFDPEQALMADYFYRGWRLTPGAKGTAQIGKRPGFIQERVDASFQEMLDSGYEPLSWNPFEQWRLARLQGIKYRQQMTLVAQLKKTGLWRPSAGKTSEGVEGIIDFDGKEWITPNIGPAFEGKLINIPENVIDDAGVETGEQVLGQARTGRGVVHPDVAKRLESMYGTLPKGLLGRSVGPVSVEDAAKTIDQLVFIPKRAKLFGSFFQQIDFLFRNFFGTSSAVIDRLAAGDLTGAMKVGYRWPSSAYKMLKANLSPNYRQELKRMLGSTEPLVPNHPGIHLKGILEAGLSIRDVNIFPSDLGDIARAAAGDAGVLGVKRVGRLISQLESAMRIGLFDGVYPAAQITDITNNVAPQMARRFGHLSDAQINGAIAEFINMRYSTIPPSQSVVQNRYLRGFLQRVFFSVGESEGLLRAAGGAFTGPYAGMWRKHWLGAYLALIGVANAIHFASTAAKGKGEFLPWERWTPISFKNWGGIPISYNRDFAAPDLPWKGRGGVDLTLDIVGQADTAFRLLNPVNFLNARESVPLRTLQNQLLGSDWYGASITEAGPMGLYSRTASAINDMFAPIGIGQSAVGIARERIPAVAAILPPGEERIGVRGQLAQAGGINVRAETTTAYKDRMATGSGLINPDTNEPVRSWDELLPRQEEQVRQMVPEFAEELQRRTETQAIRQSEYAIRRLDVQKYEGDLLSKAQRLATKYLDVPMASGNWNPEVARKAIGKAEDTYYGELYGTIWDEEKQRFTGGIYDDDIDFEEPEQNTIDHALWRYRNIYQGARNRDTGQIEFAGEPGEMLNKALSEFWASLSPGVVGEVIANVRMIEGRYPEKLQTMKAAGRYAGSTKLNIAGEQIAYYDIENHSRAVSSIAVDAGVSEMQVREYLALPYGEREPQKDYTVVGGKIGKAIDKASRKNGILWLLRKRFVDTAPEEWVLAMLDAGYSYQGGTTTNQDIMQQIRRGLSMPVTDYDALYRQNLSANR